MKREYEMESTFNGEDAFACPLIAVEDEAYIYGMRDELTFQALLNLSLNHEEQIPLLQLLPPQAMSAGSNFNCLPYDVSPPMPSPEDVAFGSFNAFPATLIRSLDGGGDFGLKLKMPKQEFSTQFGSYGYNSSGAISTVPSNFLAGVSGQFGFCHLQDLRSLEKQTAPLNTEFGYRPPQNIGASSLRYIREKATRNYRPPTYLYHPYKEPPVGSKTESRSSKLARERRQRQCEKTRYLQKLMPWETKMDMARMLEEAYKYVKFLQAQVRVLQSMPARGALPSPNPSPALQSVLGPLARLNRQQVLEVVVNSPAVQTFLYSRGCCVCSVEQLAQLMKVAEREALFEHMLITSAAAASVFRS